jgi:hypothetical protein
MKSRRRKTGMSFHFFHAERKLLAGTNPGKIQGYVIIVLVMLLQLIVQGLVDLGDNVEGFSAGERARSVRLWGRWNREMVRFDLFGDDWRFLGSSDHNVRRTKRRRTLRRSLDNVISAVGRDGRDCGDG